MQAKLEEWLVQSMTDEDMMRLARASVNSEDKVLARLSRRLIRTVEKVTQTSEEIARLKEELDYLKNKRGIQ